MKVNYIVLLTASFDVNESDFNTIMEASKNHYDISIKMLSAQGGFLYGANNRRLFSNNTDLSLDVDSRKSQYLMKMFEMDHSEDSVRLRCFFRDLYFDIKEKEEDITNHLNP